MPYPNEHAARIHDPSKYSKIHRENDKFGEGINVLWGVLPDDKTEVQAIHFSKDKFTTEQAKAWLKEHDYSTTEFSPATGKRDGILSVKRYDTARIDSVQKTKEGWLKTEAVVTRTGIFTYRNDDGSARLELRHPKDVFDMQSLSSMKMIPMTNGHPHTDTGLLDPSNVKQNQIGFTGENVKIDGDLIRISLTVTDGEAITAIEQGRRGLSLGYECDLTGEGGEYDGMRFDDRQTLIRYNHLAIVDSPRAGDAARIKLDGTCIDDVIPLQNKNPKKEERMSIVKLDDGVEYDAPQQVINALTKVTARADELTDTIKTLTSEKETLKAKVDSSEAIIAKMPEQITAAVQSRISLERKAAIVLDNEDVSKLSDVDIQKKIVLAVFPNAADQLTNASAEYLAARVDSACEVADVATREAAMASQRFQSAPHADGSSSFNEPNVEQSAAEYKNRIQNAYKGRVKKSDSKGGDDDGNPEWGSKKRKGC